VEEIAEEDGTKKKEITKNQWTEETRGNGGELMPEVLRWVDTMVWSSIKFGCVTPNSSYIQNHFLLRGAHLPNESY
jgi:hypothetical protein